jgi:hypothetical protein
MRPHACLFAIALVGTAGACRGRVHDVPDAFRWEEPVPAGTTVHLRTSSGRIEVAPTQGTVAHVSGSKRWSGRNDPIHFAWTRSGKDVYFCAMVGSGGNCGSSYRESRGMRGSWLDIFSLFKRRPTQVEASLTVELPPGVRVDARTVQGEVSVHGATSGVTAHAVNGSIEIEGAGPIEAQTINGGIEARLDSLSADDPITLETVNGAISVTLPPSAEGDVELSTVNGSVQTDFPLTASGHISGRSLHGRIGSSSREIRLKTVNGNVELSKHAGAPDDEPAPAVRGGAHP